jgi:hypothetical protein
VPFVQLPLFRDDGAAALAARACARPVREGAMARAKAPSTVGRAKPIRLASGPGTDRWAAHGVEVHRGDSLDWYARWERPDVIVSDGAYGVLGFEGDTLPAMWAMPLSQMLALT